MTISEAFDLYIQSQITNMKPKTMKNYTSVLSSFVRCFGDVPVSMITIDTTDRWKATLAYEGKQSSTIKGYTTPLRQVLKYCRTRGINVIDSRDIELPSVPRKEYAWLDYSEIQQILDMIESPRDKAIIAALADTGARISEILQLNRDSIVYNKESSQYTAQIVGKGDKLGTLYFHKASIQYIEEYLETRKDQLRPLFISGQYRRISVQRVEQFLHVYTDMAGIEKNVTPHVMRHSFASDLIMNGADIYATSKLLRHSNVSTTQRYAHVREKYNEETHKRFHSALK